MANTVDPVGGSFAIEAMTNRIEREATALLERIASTGGTLAAIETGFIQRQIQDSAYRAQQAVDSGEAIVVGVNRFVEEDEASTSLFRIDPEIERQQVARVRAVRAGRSEREWRESLAAVDRAARSSDNLVPVIINAVDRRATVGEIADTLRGVFGEYKDV